MGKPINFCEKLNFYRLWAKHQRNVNFSAQIALDLHTVLDMIKSGTTTKEQQRIIWSCTRLSFKSIVRNNSTRDINTNLLNTTTDVLVPRTKTRSWQKIICFRGGIAWNKLPPDVNKHPNEIIIEVRWREVNPVQPPFLVWQRFLWLLHETLAK